MEELLAAISALFEASPPAGLAGRLHYDQAPQDARYPYAVLVGIGAGVEDTFTEDVTDVGFQVSVFTKDSSPKTCLRFMAAVVALFKGATISPAGHADAVLTLERASSGPRRDPDDERVWHDSADFGCLLEKL